MLHLQSKIYKKGARIKLLKTLVKYLLILLLITIVVGLLLPQSYSVNKQVKIDADPLIIKSLLSDFNQWSKWSPWQKVDPSIKFIVNEPSAGIGAHQSWQSKWGYGEMTITSLTDKKMTFNILLNGEHIIYGTVKQVINADAVIVKCHVEGQATTMLVSGYMALIYDYVLGNTVTLGLNNLKTVAQLSDLQPPAKSHDSQISTSTH